jgi:PDZ domain-containing protein
LRRAGRPRYLAGAGLLLLALAAVVLLVVQSNSYLEIPDRARPLAPLVRVPGGKPDHDGGGIYYVAVVVRRASLLEKLFPPLRSEGSTLEPASTILQPGVTQREENEAEAREMATSQQTAEAVAYRELGYHVVAQPVGLRVEAVDRTSHAVGKLKPTDVIVGADGRRVRTYTELRRAIDRHKPGDMVRLAYRRGARTLTASIVTIAERGAPGHAFIGILTSEALRFELPFRAKFNLGEVGGPSAGLAFALELLEQKGRDVDHGYRVVATGQLEPDGSVVRIGGVPQKTIGARRAHADVFLVPADGGNATQAKRYAHGLRIIPVKTFQQALRALATLPKKH